ncbi:hypothetical protein [Agromyces neolithicus]|uniref:Uncharacterized protein n=1 Tax=Agromyces neolithicus TaxID=269420 RepID=A0ABN2MCI9_9MICO
MISTVGDLRDGALFDALRNRRSRRFARGLALTGGPLAYSGSNPPSPLSEEETARLAFAAAGLTGGILADWDWREESGGNMLANIAGRTIPSADAAHMATLFVIDDSGVSMMPRPGDLDSATARHAVALANDGDYLQAWRATRIRVSEGRSNPSTEFPHGIPPNRWSVSAPGTTTFLPVVESGFLLINVLLELMSERSRAVVLDDRHGFLPAGLGPLLSRRRGHLDADPRRGRTMSLSAGERVIAEMGAVEIGAMVQNLSLAAEVMGLGAFSHYALADFAGPGRTWFDELGFTMQKVPLTKLFGVPAPARWALKAQRRDITMRMPIGLEVGGRTVLRAHRPPYFPSMAAAVDAVAEHKLGDRGSFRAGAVDGRWSDAAGFAEGVPAVSAAGREATIAFAEYVWRRYGRFPVGIGSFHSLVAVQVAHLDEDFYDRHYRTDSLTDAHRRHESVWHTDSETV